MRVFLCYFLLLLALFCQLTTEVEEKGLEKIASRMQHLKRELLDLDVFCKRSFRRDIRLLRETASKLDSARAHVSDNLGLYSSRAGLVGGTMMLAGLIPNPFSPVLFYYGSYLSMSSAIGHVSNVVLVEESYDLAEVAQVIQNLNKFYEVMIRVEDAYDALLKLQPEAILRGQNGRTLSKEKQQKILLEIEKLWDKKVNLEEKRKITLAETIDYTNSLIDFLGFARDAFDTVGGGSIDISQEDYHEYKSKAVGLPKQAYSVSKFVRDISHRSVKRVASSIIQYGSVQTQNIEEVLRKIQERGELIRLLRDTADDMERVCNGSPYCVA
ncbi:hypothetical protein HOLleu_25303 [Holothuria leucospilota]|uniref:Uncharacterized protein n=1 Tax=Holothuria leucospilota TaxID=206669 RepID=A0A9Q1H497_HOLLE|nr:hypothetical protein HOLleu_25303 [Holothuria leucospilota]